MGMKCHSKATTIIIARTCLCVSMPDTKTRATRLPSPSLWRFPLSSAAKEMLTNRGVVHVQHAAANKQTDHGLFDRSLCRGVACRTCWGRSKGGKYHTKTILSSIIPDTVRSGPYIVPVELGRLLCMVQGKSRNAK